MSVNVASIASRGRRVYNQQTVLHVLRLVHSQYTPIPRPAIRQQASLLGRSIFDSPDGTRSVASVRRFGNARAVQEDEVVSDDHDVPQVDEPPIGHNDPVTLGSHSDPRDIPPDLLHFVQRDDDIDLSNRRDNDVVEPHPAQVLYAELSSGRYRSVGHLISAEPDHISFASLPSLRTVLYLFEQRNATEDQWIWLARRLVDLRAVITATKIDVDVRLFPLVHLVIAHCLSQPSHTFRPVSPDRAWMVTRLLDRAAASHSISLRKIVAPPPLESTLSAVLLARMGEWDAAKTSMYSAFTPRNLKEPYNRVDLRFLHRYHGILERNERLDDFYEIITKKADAIVNALSKGEAETEVGVSETGVVSTALGQSLYALLGRIERVDRWFAATLQQELQSVAQKEITEAGPSDNTRRDTTKKLSKQTRALGSLLFMAFGQKPERMEETLGLLRQLFYHGIWPPAHRVADFCEILTAAGRQNHVLEAYNRLARVQGEWSAQLLRRFISILLRNELAFEADELHAELVSLPSATSRDRTMVAFHYAQRGNVDAVEENLQRTFGAEWLKVIESLAMLLEVWLARRTGAKVRRFVRLIAKFARTKTAHLNYLLNYFAQRGQVSEGLTVFNSFLDRRRGNKPDLGTFSALIRLFSRQGDIRNVDRIVQGAVESGITLNGPFCAQIIEAGIRSQDWLTVSRRWSAFPPDIKAHPFVVAAIMKAFVYLAVPYDFVLSFFGSIEKPAHSHWHMIILSACDARNMLAAERLLLAMERRALHHHSAPRPDRHIYATVMHGYLRLNQMDHAEQTFNRMATRKLVPTGVTFAMMIDAFDRNYSASNNVEQAYRFSVTVFERQQRGMRQGEEGHARRFARFNLYARLIRMAGARGMRRRVDALYHEATKNTEPTIATQTIVLQAYYRMGHTRSAQRLWADMFERARRIIGTGPSTFPEEIPQSNVLCQALSMILQMTADAGEHDAVVAIWKDVTNAGFGLDSASYNAYARALAVTGNLDGALHVLDHVLLSRADASKNIADRIYGATGDLESLSATAEHGLVDQAGAEGERSSIEPSEVTDAEVTAAAPSESPSTAPSKSPSTAPPESPSTAEKPEATQFWTPEISASTSPTAPAQPPSSSFPGRYLSPDDRLSTVSSAGSQQTVDADPARPSDKRPKTRAVLQNTPIAVDSSAAVGSEALTRDVLERWRPGNVSWAPSTGLCSVLCASLNQLEWLASSARGGLDGEDNASTPELVGPIYLRKEVSIPLRARDGTVLHALPVDVLGHYRARYPSATKFIDGLRAEQAARQKMDERKISRRIDKLAEKALRDLPHRRQREYYALRSARSGIIHPRAKKLPRDSPWRSLKKWQEVMAATPEQWAELKGRAEQRRMGRVSSYKGNWGLMRPPRHGSTRTPRLADVKAAGDETRRAQMVQELEQMVRLSTELVEKKAGGRYWAIAPRRKNRPKVYGLEAKRQARELREREQRRVEKAKDQKRLNDKQEKENKGQAGKEGESGA